MINELKMFMIQFPIAEEVKPFSEKQIDDFIHDYSDLISSIADEIVKDYSEDGELDLIISGNFENDWIVLFDKVMSITS